MTRSPLAAVVVLSAFGLAPDASACQCVPYHALYVALPIDGDASAPTNPAIVWLAFDADDAAEALADVVVVTDPPVEVGASLDDRTIAGTGALVLTLDRELPPGTAVRVEDPGSETPWVAFTVGDTADTSPPEVDRVDIAKKVDDDNSCAPANGPSVTLTFTLEGLTDDRTPTDALVVHLAPVTVGRDIWAIGPVASAHLTLCGGDPTLARDRDRRYTLEALDAAGNAGATRRVSTCGCARGGGGDFSVAAAGVALVFGGRRRSRRGRPRR